MSRRRPGFTLVEMLVVIGIIVVLVSLLVPVAAIAVSRTRNFHMTAEISQLATAVESYKKEKGDYPPSLGEIDSSGSLYVVGKRYNTVAEKHLRKCYPKMTQAEKDFFYDNIAQRLTGDEALVFWLSMTQNDERNPFTSRASNFKKYYDFKPERLVDFDSDPFVGNFPDGQPGRLDFASYKASYAGETPYVYLESRTYAMHRKPANAISQMVQAYFNENPATVATQKHYVNDTTFQIICAGQDREFGAAFQQFTDANVVDTPKRFKSGENYTDDDKDNLANFSEGRMLGDHIP